ncbi:hypothetical protein [Mycoplasmopsis columboralis]|uniref:Chromosome segregation protein n=1 Tax=Mycoplasmopsis columboralis TaxID=171282 RepID=A0A449B5R9_9BACT|nr:hypothetical protein [Mycoplasmopsis columboralis]VEU75954.1 chromosome segregation protein [Mycoplasmopsis columboralis]
MQAVKTEKNKNKKWWFIGATAAGIVAGASLILWGCGQAQNKKEIEKYKAMLDGVYAKNQSDYSRFNFQIGDLQNDIERMRNDAMTQSETLNYLREQIAQKEQALLKLVGSKNYNSKDNKYSNTSELGKLKSELQSLQIEFEKVSLQRDNLLKDKASLEEQLNQLKTERDNLKVQLQLTIEQNNEEIARLNTIIAMLENDKEDLQNQNNSLQEQLQSAKNKVAELESVKRTIEEEIASKSEQINDLETQNQTLKEQYVDVLLELYKDVNLHTSTYKEIYQYLHDFDYNELYEGDNQPCSDVREGLVNECSYEIPTKNFEQWSSEEQQMFNELEQYYDNADVKSKYQDKLNKDFTKVLINKGEKLVKQYQDFFFATPDALNRLLNTVNQKLKDTKRNFTYAKSLLVRLIGTDNGQADIKENGEGAFEGSIVDKLRKRIAQLEQEKENNLTQIQTLQEEKQNLQNDKTRLESEKTALENDLQTKEQRIAQFSDQVQTLNTTITNLNNEKAQLQQSLSEKDTQIQTLQEQVSNLQEQLRNKETQNQDLSNQLQAKQNQLQVLQREKEQLQSQLNTSNSNLTKAKRKLVELAGTDNLDFNYGTNGENVNTDSIVKRLKDKLITTRDSNTSLQQKLDALVPTLTLQSRYEKQEKISDYLIKLSSQNGLQSKSTVNSFANESSTIFNYKRTENNDPLGNYTYALPNDFNSFTNIVIELEKDLKTYSTDGNYVARETWIIPISSLSTEPSKEIDFSTYSLSSANSEVLPLMQLFRKYKYTARETRTERYWYRYAGVSGAEGDPGTGEWREKQITETKNYDGYAKEDLNVSLKNKLIVKRNGNSLSIDIKVISEITKPYSLSDTTEILVANPEENQTYFLTNRKYWKTNTRILNITLQ